MDDAEAAYWQRCMDQAYELRRFRKWQDFFVMLASGGVLGTAAAVLAEALSPWVPWGFFGMLLLIVPVEAASRALWTRKVRAAEREREGWRGRGC